MFKFGFVSALVGAALTLTTQACYAYGEEGHSIVAEIAQRRLTPTAQAEVNRVLGASMASVASWADGVKSDDKHPETARWHYVDIPMGESRYDQVRDCKVMLPSKQPKQDGGDCVIAELSRLRKQVCAPSDDVRHEALRYAIHLIGDIHQPLHTALEQHGGNDVHVAGAIHNKSVCTNGCTIAGNESLHSYWDTGLIRMTYYDWGSYVADLEAEGGPLRDVHVQQLGAEPNPVVWANDTHDVAKKIWSDKLKVETDGPNRGKVILNDDYYNMSKPLLDIQLALGGLRLAQFLNAAYADPTCGAPPPPNIGKAKSALKPYYLTKVRDGKTQYELDQDAVAGAATEYLLSRLSDTTLTKPAIVLDIDETSLNNLVQLQADDFGFIPNGPCTLESGYACGTGGTPALGGLDGWDGQKKATAIAPTKALFDAAISHHVAVFFVTGRRAKENEEQVTADNLNMVGYKGYTQLFLRPIDSQGGVGSYKANTRAKIENEMGYRIILNLGDQGSDLIGGHAEQSFQMPNPFYYIQ